MVQELNLLWAGDLHLVAGWTLAAGLAGGVALWLGGSRVSRTLVTLTAVAVGTLVGKHLPAWKGWTVDPMGTAMAGAMLCGLSGYVMHRFWMAMGLAALAFAWAGAITWTILELRGELVWPAWGAAGLEGWVRDLWQLFDERTARMLACCCGVSAVSAFAMAVMWPRAATMLFYSLLGVSMGLPALAEVARRAEGWDFQATSFETRLAVAGALVLAGVVIQWRWSRDDEIPLPAQPLGDVPGSGRVADGVA